MSRIVRRLALLAVNLFNRLAVYRRSAWIAPDPAFDDADFLIVMEPNMIGPPEHCSTSGKRLRVLLHGLLRHDSQQVGSDPYNGPKERFEGMFDMVENHVGSLARRLT